VHYYVVMLKIAIRLIVQALAIYITAWLLSGVSVDGLYASLVVAIVLSLINTFIKPVLLLLTLPINVITLGLFTFVVNALLILAADHLVQGFAVANFWWAIIFGLVLSVINWVLVKIVE